MKRDLLDAIGKIDPRYIEEAAGVQQQASAEKQQKLSTEESLSTPTTLQSRKRSFWPVAAAASFLVLALGTGALLLSKRTFLGTDPTDVWADTPSHSESLSSTDPTQTDDPVTQAPTHTLDLDFDALRANTKDEEILFACDYLQSKTPSAENEMTGLFAGKNLILITANSFAPQLIDRSRTPTLYRLATQGIEFSDYYQPAWGGAASTGQFAFLTGLVPANGAQSMLDVVGKDMGLTIGNQLRQQGYFSRAYTDYFSYDYEHQDCTLPNLGYEELLGVGNGLESVMTKQWPYSDREMMNAVISQVLDQQPFSVYCMTCSGQGIYDRFGNKMAEKHWSEVEMLPYSDKVKGYLAANMEIEYALRDLVEALEQAGIADDTVIVLTSSGYPYALEQNENYGNLEDYLTELYGKPVESCFERDRSTLIIWSGCLEGKNYKVATPTSSLDILPTLSNLFGLEFDSRLSVGRDVFSDQAPLVFWPDGSWITEQYSYNAETRVYSNPNGSQASGDTQIPYEYAMEQHEALESRIRYSAAVLNTELFTLLLGDTE